MNIALNQVEQYHESAKTGASQIRHTGNDAYEKDSNASAAAFLWGGSNVIGNQAYRDGKEQTGDLLSDALNFDAKNSKDFMVVMSNTLSDEDYKKIQEQGGNPASYEPGEMVTVLDQIKVTLAKAGVRIEGFTDDLNADAIKEAAGNEAYAAAIARALTAKDLPATEKNIKDCYNEIEKASHLTDLSDGAKKYMLENGLEPTIDSLYKASYAGAKDDAEQPSGYFGAGTGGYLAKKGTASDLSSMEEEMKKAISRSGLPVNEETMENARWLLEKGLPLSEENLIRLGELENIEFPISPEEAAMAAADAISVGMAAKEADLTVGEGYHDEKSGYIAKAEELNEKVQALTDEDIMEVIRRGRSLTLFQLFQIGNTDTSVQNEKNRPAIEAAGEEAMVEFTAAKRQLVEIQLHMSAQANLKLMKQGIHIELAPLDKLLDMLKKEESLFHSTEFAKMNQKTEEIKSLPAAAIGVSVKEAWQMQGVFTLDKFYETGKSLAAVYAKAGESYEALMTAPRADLGDNIKTAFRNVDELLVENGMEVSEDNRRAVRILGYNQMEITEEHLDAVKEADALLNKVLSRLTPERTLKMIREGVNPMDMDLEDLSDYLSGLESETAEIEKYSKYLYKLEKNQEITDEEKDAYIGIYRLLRQVEKGDGAALGTVVSNGQKLNLENLLGAVRTRKKGYVDAKIDEAFGLLNEIEKKGTSISDQISRYFENKAGNLADDLSNALGEGEEEAMLEELARLRSTGTVSEEHFNSLLESNIPVNAQNVLAQEALSSQGSLFQDMAGLLKEKGREKDFEKKLDKIKDAVPEGREALEAAYEDLAESGLQEVKELSEESGSYIDVRSMALYGRQLSLISNHAKEENYYVPVQLSGEWSMLHVQVVSGKGQGRVFIDYKGKDGEDGGASAAFIAKGESLEGLIGVSRQEDVEIYNKIAKNCAKQILEKTGKEADITCVHSKSLHAEAFGIEKEKEEKSSTAELYKIAKAFIEVMEQEVI